MKLAEALALRAEATRRIEQLRGRIIDNARYQDGEEPAEDAASLLAQTGEACAELESLIRRINRTNAVARLGAGTITDAIARRDMLKLRHSVITAAADAAAGRERGWSRHLRSELTFISALPVADCARRQTMWRGASGNWTPTFSAPTGRPTFWTNK
jgi:hypothetical protein